MKSQQPKKNNKALIIVVILAIIGIVVGILLFNNQNKKESSNNNKQVENNNNASSDLTEEGYTGTKQNITIATVGNVDHGKSTLTSAITKLYGEYITDEEISIAPEVSKNGIKYSATLVEYETQTRHYFHYDMPAHSDYVKAIISGSVKLDGAILVVSAPDGVMAQTREQLKLLQQSGVSKVIIYISKCDMLDDSKSISSLEMELRELISKYGFDGKNTPIIKGSALKAIEGDKDGETSIQELITSMDKWITKKTSTEKATSHTKFNAVVYLLTKEEGGSNTPLFSDYKPQISISNSRESATINLPSGIDMVMPGDSVDMTISFKKSTYFKKGDNFQMYKDGKLVGIGVVESIIK